MKRKFISALLLLAVVCSMSSCDSFKEGFKQSVEQVAKGEITTGAWSEDGTVFTNEWSNIKFSKPDGYTAATQEEIDAMTKQNLEASGQSGIAADLALARVRYDFLVVADGLGMPSILLMYENTENNPAMKNLDEGGYLDTLAEQFEAMAAQGFTYTEVERTTTNVAGVEWTVGTFSLNDGVVTQRYYLRKVDDVFYELILSYNAATETAAEELIAGLSSAV